MGFGHRPHRRYYSVAHVTILFLKICRTYNYNYTYDCANTYMCAYTTLSYIDMGHVRLQSRGHLPATSLVTQLQSFGCHRTHDVRGGLDLTPRERGACPRWLSVAGVPFSALRIVLCDETAVAVKRKSICSSRNDCAAVQVCIACAGGLIRMQVLRSGPRCWQM